MNERYGKGGDNAFEQGRSELRREVQEDGGIHGIFTLARVPGNLDNLIDKYRPLITAAISPEEDQERQRKYREEHENDPVLDPTDKAFMEVASVEGLDPGDAHAMLLAVIVYDAAFPTEISADESEE